jgi:hypothetical protein
MLFPALFNSCLCALLPFFSLQPISDSDPEELKQKWETLCVHQLLQERWEASEEGLVFSEAVSEEELAYAKEKLRTGLEANAREGMETFVGQSLEVIEHMELSDLSPEWNRVVAGSSDCAQDNTSLFRLCEPKKRGGEEWGYSSALAMPWDVRLVDIGSEPAISFYQLPLNSNEERIIRYIISTMAEKNVFQLAFEKFSMEKKGKKINQVHPLRFIGFILSDPDLNNDLRTIKKSSFKWDAFISGFARKMREETSKNNVAPYIPEFAALVNADPKEIEYYLHKKDYEGLVKYLL